MQGVILVFLGGGAGAVCRFLIGKAYNPNELGFPTGTLIANIISCLLLGILMGFVFKNNLDQKLQWLLMAGFCGGFSTFSTFSAESFRLMQDGQFFMALSYITVSILACIFSIFFAYYMVIKLS